MVITTSASAASTSATTVELVVVVVLEVVRRATVLLGCGRRDFLVQMKQMILVLLMNEEIGVMRLGSRRGLDDGAASESECLGGVELSLQRN